MIHISLNPLAKYRRTLLTAATAAAIATAVGTIAVGVSGCGGDKGTQNTDNTPVDTGNGTGTGTDPGTGNKELKTVTIGGKVWMAENLNVETGNSWCYSDEAAFCKRYGRLYDWNTAQTACPEGWRLPAEKDWDDLVAAVGGDAEAGFKLKAGRDWASGGGGNDTLGFSALPGGVRFSDDGTFGRALFNGYWWSAADKDDIFAYYRGMSSQNGKVVKSDERKARGHSVRCVKN